MKKLTAENVNEVFMKCLFEKGEDSTDAIIVQGVQLNVGFNPNKISENKNSIQEFLSQLPAEFNQLTGGGWSFLNACNNREGNQWTDFHTSIDQLLCLGLAADLIAYNAPRSLWNIFPGGMPYFMIKY